MSIPFISSNPPIADDVFNAWVFCLQQPISQLIRVYAMFRIMRNVQSGYDIRTIRALDTRFVV
jgi:hypothetical protein